MLKEFLKDIASELNFKVAFERIKYDAQFDYLQMPVELSIFEAFFEKNINYLKESVLNGTYSISPLRKIWVPKEKYFLRPGSLPMLEDRLIFQALVDKVAKDIEKQLHSVKYEVVFSSHLNPDLSSNEMFLNRGEQWLSFKKKAVQYCGMQDVEYVLVTDIASYFENINLDMLANLMRSAGVGPAYVDAISYILKIWANGRTRGLPQMLAPCSLLADFYLNQVDKNMVLAGYRYIRYVDDIRIFVSANVDLRKAMLELTEQLRPYYLDLQSSKTDFFLANDFKENLTLIERHMLECGIEENEQDALFYFNPSPSAKSIPEEKLILFKQKLLTDNAYNARDLRFCINNLGRIGSSSALELVLSKLYSMPEETYHFVRYLFCVLPYITADIVDKIIDFLESNFNIYDWQMMWLLILLSKCTSVSQDHLQRLIKNKNLQKYYINKALVIYILCSKGGKIYQDTFMEQYNKEKEIEIRMAILCGLYSLDYEERERFYDLAEGNFQIQHLIDVLRYRKIEFSQSILAFLK